MQTFVLLTRLSPEAIREPSQIEELEKKVSEKLRAQCPEAKWIGSYSIMGPCDYLDIFEAPDERSAARVALIVRSFGHATTEIWGATPWEKFVGIAREMSQPARAGR